ncbi:transcription factor, contains a PHD finger motif, partial [Coemansia sp. RSA 2559]
LQAPCGSDVFSYSMRAKPSTRFHVSRGSFYGEDYGPGDTLGVLLFLPPLDKDEKQDLEDRKWHPGERYRQFTYSRPVAQRPPYANSELPPLPVLAGSELVYFKNGKCLGPAFQKLYLGKYYPAISTYMGGKVMVNLGPTFKYPPPETWHENTPIRPITDLEFTLPTQPAKPEEVETAAATSETTAPPAENEPAGGSAAATDKKEASPIVDQPAAEESTAEEPTTEEPTTEEPTTEESESKDPESKDPAATTAKEDQPAAEQPGAERTNGDPTPETSKTDSEPLPTRNDIPSVVEDSQDFVMESVEKNPADQLPTSETEAPKPEATVANAQHSATPPVSQMEAATIASEKDTPAA